MAQKSSIGLIIVTLLLTLVASLTTSYAESEPTSLTTAQLRNLFLPADGLGGGIQLVDGVAEEYAADGEIRALYEVKNPIALGDLNSDGLGDGAIVLAIQPMNGDSIIYSVQAVLNVDGQAELVAFAVLGENIQLVNFAIRDGQIVVDMIRHGEDDPECCATQTAHQVYQLQKSGAFDLVLEQDFAEAGLPFAFDDKLTWRELANLTYPETLDYRSLDLVNASYAYTMGDYSLAYMLLDDVVLYGDLTGDGLDEAVVMLQLSINNEPIMQHLYVVLNDRGIPYIAGWQDYSRVSDVEITSIQINDQVLTVDYSDITHNNALSDTFMIVEGHLISLD